MSFECKIIADSVSPLPDKIRLTTFEITFPRFILAELNTHRMLSRNSASSRAIPTEKIIERVKEDPFVPMTFNRRVKGMGVGERLEESDEGLAQKAWLIARDHAVVAAQQLVELDVDKSRANRLLEPFMWHTAIVTATEWENFFGLRDHEAAQPEFRHIVRAMRFAMHESEPTRVHWDEWHLPYVDPEDYHGWDWELGKKISASRCARVSYLKHADAEPLENTLERYERLRVSGHLSPFEHPATPVRLNSLYSDFHGNFRGWQQHRKEIPFEDNFDMAQMSMVG